MATLCRCTHTQNNCYWSFENQCQLLEQPLHGIKFWVWHAVTYQRVVRPLFFNATINSGHYTPLSKNWCEAKTCGYSSHGWSVTVKIKRVFSQQVIKQQPLGSPYLNLCNFYLWRTLKDRVHVNYSAHSRMEWEHSTSKSEFSWIASLSILQCTDKLWYLSASRTWFWFSLVNLGKNNQSNITY